MPVPNMKMGPYREIFPADPLGDLITLTVEPSARGLPAGSYSVRDCYCCEPYCGCGIVLWLFIRKHTAGEEEVAAVQLNLKEGGVDLNLHEDSGQGPDSEMFLQSAAKMISLHPQLLQKIQERNAKVRDMADRREIHFRHLL